MSGPIELQEQMPVTTKLGPGYAIIFESGEHDNHWTIILDKGGAIVTLRQQDIRAASSYTRGRGMSHKRMARIVR